MEVFSNSFSEETWFQKYKFKDDTCIQDTWKRVARDLASIEEDQDKWTKKFYQALESFKFVPGGRITSNAGTGLTGTTMINCFHGSTEIITREGICKIKDLVDKDVLLLGRSGKWSSGKIQSFGKQRIFKLTVKKNRQLKTILTTGNHKWFAYTKANKNLVELTTEELQSYHRLEQSVSKSHHSTSPSPIGVAQGFTYGDGSSTPYNNVATNVSLRGAKYKVLAPYFGLYSVRTYGGFFRIPQLPNSWRRLPELTENASFLLGWLAGYFAADGCVSSEGECTVASAELDNIKFVKSICSVLGIRYFKEKSQEGVSNLTNRNSTIHSLCLDSKDLNNSFFIIPDHKQRFIDKPRTKKHHWKVVSVEDTGIDDSVYCAVVPTTHKFALEGNILTSNCFVDGFEGQDLDSIEGIYDTLLKQAQILKSEGGYGFCADIMRPNGAHIKGIANQSPGSVKFLELWDKSSEIITAGSNKQSRDDEKNFIRKGAQMVTMSCWHPDIVEFITAKETPGRLTKFNMSVLCTDNFMSAVQNDEPWDLVFPNYEAYSKDYKKHWDGNLDKWVELCNAEDALVVYHSFKSARELWDLVMTNTYNRNEPGVLFVDTMNKMNNLKYCEWVNATNPCGEQVLPIGGVCLLGSINLVHFIDVENKTWKFNELKKTIHTAVRFMDNVNDITNVPLKSQKKSLQEKRRIGLGVLGYGSALLMARVKYGGKKALEMTEELMGFFTNEAYKANAMLAKEKGVFDLYDEEEYLSSEFLKNLDDDTINLIKKHGMRNSHVTSIQPTGNSSCFANLVSGGIEPLFMHGYVRTSIQPAPADLQIPVKVDWANKSYKGNGWSWAREGDEDLLVTEFENKVWKYDRHRGLTKEEWIEDYGVSALKQMDKWNPNSPWAACTMDLSVDAHVKTMSVFAKWVDSAISKTINLPNDYSYSHFKLVYKKAWENGIKGFTTYRAGTMTSVLSAESSLKDPIIPDRPRELPCDVYHITVKGVAYFVLVGLLDKNPHEVFAGKNGFIDKKVVGGTIIKLGRPKGVYKAILDNGLELSPINATCSAEEDALTRMTSLSLRHGADMHTVVGQLEKVKGDMHCFAKSMARAIKKYIPDGSKEEGQCPDCSATDSLIRQEGCITCTQCSFSKCA